MLGAEKTDVEIYGRKFTLELEGLNQLEINAVAQLVDERMRLLAGENRTADTGKLGILTALEIAAELQRMKSRMQDFDRVEEKAVDRMILELEKAAE